MQVTRSVWTDHSLRNPSEDPRPAASCRLRWPRNSLLLQTALACCGAAVAQAARAQDTVPWRVVDVEIQSYVRSFSYGGGYGYVQCEYQVQSDVRSWKDDAGLEGTFSGSASISYECCSKGGYYYGYSYDCFTNSLGVGGSMSIGSDGLAVHPGGCMEYETCSSDIRFTVVFDRPMRMTWDDCCSGNDCCYNYGCAIDGSPCGGGSEEFPGAYVAIDQGTPVGHYFTSYSFYFEGGSGEFSFVDHVRFERMFPADVFPDRVVNGLDISAILSKWGSGHDPQRNPRT